MVECARSVRKRGILVAAVATPLVGFQLANCTGTDKPSNVDTLDNGDVAAPRFDARSFDSNASSDSSSSSSGAASSSGSAGCEAGLTFCNGGCTDTSHDPDNCGQCANACGNGLSCIGGHCDCRTDAGQTLCSAACVVLNTDPNNCGACGHGCQGSMCANGLCQPTVVASIGGQPIQDMAVDSSYVYWTQIATNSSPGVVGWKEFAGSMTTLSISGNDMDPNLANPYGIAVDNLNVYWVDVGNGAVEVMSKGTLKLGQPLRASLLVDGGMSDSPYDIVSDGKNVYFVTYDGGQVISAPITAGTGPTVVIAGAQNHPRAIAVDAANVYWVNFGNANSSVPSGSILQAPKGAPATPATMKVLAQGEDQPWDIAVDDTSVYWTDHANPGQIRKVPIGGGNAVTLASGQGAPYGIAVNASYVYWTNVDDKNVMRLSKSDDAGAPFAIAINQSTPSVVVVDNMGNVYWADPGAGAILKLAQ